LTIVEEYQEKSKTFKSSNSLIMAVNKDSNGYTILAFHYYGSGRWLLVNPSQAKYQQ
jgi:hypothetical protein